jgi:hypothetical protein
MNKHKRYCFEADEKKFKKIIAHNTKAGIVSMILADC